MKPKRPKQDRLKLDDSVLELVNLLEKYPDLRLAYLEQYGKQLTILEALRAHDKTQRIIAHYENQTEDAAVAEDEEGRT